MAITQPGTSRLTRNTLTGMLVLLLGAWGALVPFFGPTFNFGFAPDHSWTWTSSRAWLQVLPGAAAALGGLILLVTAYRAVAIAGAWLAAVAAAWYVVGPSLAHLLRIPAIGSPIKTSTGMVALQWLALFYGLGALILFLSAIAMGRLTVRTAVVLPATATEPSLTQPAMAGLAERPIGDRHHNDRSHAHRHFGRRRAHAGTDQSPVADGERASGDTTASTTGDQMQSM